ncbi:unnamed protein product [Spirodela intermedia]|uniref:SOSEKI DIX-like domain-containing protein n=1 Tax=Spirodela intermedia TaxID=51605 RepID=A0A7I8KE55_SPIIN|nr:unnamed protein product [Spirodela intermedia]
MDTAASGAAAAARARRSRETSPDRARAAPSAKPRPLRKVQIVYYLCRNGQLEHPHFMEVAHHSSQQLRLKDVMDRLTFLRGKGMPSLFSWSCKRSYKNGFVWNDLAENDVIQPADGAAEYILKGSEIIEGCSEGFRRLQVGGGNRGKLLRGGEPEEDVGEEADEEETEEEKPWRSQQRSARFSRARHSELVLDDDASPPSSSSSEKAHPPVVALRRAKGATASVPARYDDAYPAEEPPPAQQQQPRSSVLLQLIACGSSVVGKGRAAPPRTAAPAPASGGHCSSGRKSAAALHREVLCKAAAAAAVEEEDAEDISQMPLNPNPRREEKEYFSGSIVDSLAEMSRAAAGPCLKKSSSYNEERSAKCGLGGVYEAAATASAAEERGQRSGAGKCIPGGRKRIAGDGGGGKQ